MVSEPYPKPKHLTALFFLEKNINYSDQCFQNLGATLCLYPGEMYKLHKLLSAKQITCNKKFGYEKPPFFCLLYVWYIYFSRYEEPAYIFVCELKLREHNWQHPINMAQDFMRSNFMTEPSPATKLSSQEFGTDSYKVDIRLGKVCITRRTSKYSGGLSTNI